jgi:hypothetical protein
MPNHRPPSMDESLTASQVIVDRTRESTCELQELKAVTDDRIADSYRLIAEISRIKASFTSP